MLDIFSLSLLFGYLLLIIYRTNAFVEYLTLLKLSRFFKIYEYHKLATDGFKGTYINFLVEYYYNNFFVRLLSCPICTSFWLGIVTAAIYGSFSTLIVAPITLACYSVLNRLL